MKLTERIQSRKFLLALLACLWFAFTGEPKVSFPAITQVVAAYLAVTAAQDALTNWSNRSTTELPPE